MVSCIYFTILPIYLCTLRSEGNKIYYYYYYNAARGSALSDNRAVDLIHVERQTQHVRRNILYRLYFHYFLEQIKYRLMTSIVNQY